MYSFSYSNGSGCLVGGLPYGQQGFLPAFYPLLVRIGPL